uniref:Uncharacterized protein n=1 Tax=Anguilla anguilla TaxID=7936 RepID=A0A0E9TW71_ANGAN
MQKKVDLTGPHCKISDLDLLSRLARGFIGGAALKPVCFSVSQ